MLALLYDVHGNRAGLEAVLEDAREAGAESFLLGGDYGLFGPQPAETVELLRGLADATWIRGNVDRWADAPDRAPDDSMIGEAITALRVELGEKVVAELGALSEQVVLDGVRYCHASPLSDLRSFLPEESSEDAEMMDGATERRVVFGHTHLQFRREGPGGSELVNPGSVGMPLDGDQRAAYALVGLGGELQLRRVAYDHEGAARAMDERFGDAAWAQRTARRLRSARP